jgi:DNA-binding FadR family transcriptional regulator
MQRGKLTSEFLNYLITNGIEDPLSERLPPLNVLSKKLGVSVPTLREQMEAARTLGLVEARPRTGIRRLPYTFQPAVRQSLAYAIAIDPGYFESFAELRQHIEFAFWFEAVQRLTPQDHEALQALVDRAWEKLRGSPIQIPHAEHRELHLSIYRRLDNPFVLGILEAYWEAYEAVGLSVYSDYYYLEQVWRYHQQMVDAICCGDLDSGYKALVEHAELLHHLPINGHHE